MGMDFRIRPPDPAAHLNIKRRSLQQFGAAVALAADQTAKTALDRTRGQMSRTKLGKLSRAITYGSDLKKKRVPDINAAGSNWKAGAFVFSRGTSERTAGAIDAYSNGTVSIVPRRGRWLAIATDELAARVPGIKSQARKGKYRMTPKLYRERGLEKKIGPLIFVRNGNSKEALLIVNNVQVNAARGFGGARRIPKTGNVKAGKVKKDFIVAFVLIRITRRAERFNPKAIFRAEFSNMPKRIRANLRSRPAIYSNGKVVASWSSSFTI